MVIPVGKTKLPVTVIVTLLQRDVFDTAHALTVEVPLFKPKICPVFSDIDKISPFEDVQVNSF